MIEEINSDSIVTITPVSGSSRLFLNASDDVLDGWNKKKVADSHTVWSRRNLTQKTGVVGQITVHSSNFRFVDSIGNQLDTNGHFIANGDFWETSLSGITVKDLILENTNSEESLCQLEINIPDSLAESIEIQSYTSEGYKTFVKANLNTSEIITYNSDNLQMMDGTIRDSFELYSVGNRSEQISGIRPSFEYIYDSENQTIKDSNGEILRVSTEPYLSLTYSDSFGIKNRMGIGIKIPGNGVPNQNKVKLKIILDCLNQCLSSFEFEPDSFNEYMGLEDVGNWIAFERSDKRIEVYLFDRRIQTLSISENFDNEIKEIEVGVKKGTKVARAWIRYPDFNKDDNSDDIPNFVDKIDHLARKFGFVTKLEKIRDSNGDVLRVESGFLLVRY